jgi:signal transduction histidine kinase
MFVNFLSKHDFSYQDMIIGQLLANQAATAIQNAGLANAKEQQQREEQVRAMLTVATRFAGEFAHKLTSVVGTTPTWIELAAEQLSGSDVEKDVLRYLQAIKTELSELDDVAQLYEKSLVDTSDQSETREWIAVQDLIESVVNRVSNSMPKSVGQVAVAIQCHPRWLRVRTARYNLSSVLYNLIRNAYEAMPDKGELNVGCVAEPNTRSSIIITVHDTGVGIPDNQIGKIFDPGFTTKGHMGVGLMYVKEIVESMGGRITPKSEVGKGTTITVMLPMEFQSGGDAQFT